MTAEKFTEEILYQSHSLGIRKEVMELASELREKDRTLNFNGAVEEAFNKLTK